MIFKHETITRSKAYAVVEIIKKIKKLKTFISSFNLKKIMFLCTRAPRTAHSRKISPRQTLRCFFFPVSSFKFQWKIYKEKLNFTKYEMQVFISSMWDVENTFRLISHNLELTCWSVSKYTEFLLTLILYSDRAENTLLIAVPKESAHF
jgi:hypothetical protein